MAYEPSSFLTASSTALARSREGFRLKLSSIRWGMTSVSVLDLKIWPRFSSSSLNSVKFSIIPLWTTAISPLQSTCGWALTFNGAPWVAHRVCPTPTFPGKSSRLWTSWTSSIFPWSFFMWSLPLCKAATPTESYPRYSSRFRASCITGAEFFSFKMHPNIPHISETFFDPASFI